MLVKGKISTKNRAIRLNIVGMFVENRKKYIFLSIVMNAFIIFNIFSQEELFIRETNIMFTLADGYVLLLLNVSLKNDTQT